MRLMIVFAIDTKKHSVLPWVNSNIHNLLADEFLSSKLTVITTYTPGIGKCFSGLKIHQLHH